MAKEKHFIAVSSEVYKNRLVLLNTSEDRHLISHGGMSTLEVLDWLMKLAYVKRKGKSVTFICYAFSRDNEFLFSGLPTALKNRLFENFEIRTQLASLDHENEQLTNTFYTGDKDAKAEAKLGLDINKLVEQELKEVIYKGYKISLANGKRLTIRKGKHSVTIYDIYYFYRKPLRAVVKQWLDKDIPALEKSLDDDFALFEGYEIQQLKKYSDVECKFVAQVATELNKSLLKEGITLSRWFGASSVTSWLLSNSKAKKSFHNYRHSRQLPPELTRASKQAFYGGRIEQFKLGKVEKVNVYDINSAYAYATTYLPVMKRKPSFATEFKPTPFSLWYLEYDFRGTDCYYGLLPHRENKSFTRYKVKGKGFYWMPEIAYLMANYPECIEVKYGYYLDYVPAPFTKSIRWLYDLRLELKANNNPLENVIKLALATIYGKFCQHNGKGYYYNLFYAGYITSFVRAMLMQATRGVENETVSFQTDAIHTTATLPVTVNDQLGEYKQSNYQYGIYLDNGIYGLFNNDVRVKTKSRGIRNFDFDKALQEFASKSNFEAVMEFFVGHNLYTANLLRSGEYLKLETVEKKISPLETTVRLFEMLDKDLTKDFVDSHVVSAWADRESGIYHPSIIKDADMAMESINARRI